MSAGMSEEQLSTWLALTDICDTIDKMDDRLTRQMELISPASPTQLLMAVAQKHMDCAVLALKLARGTSCDKKEEDE